MHGVVRRLQQKSQRPVGSRLYNQGEGDHFTAYMVAKSKEKNPVKLSKMIDIPSTLPQSWWQKLLRMPGRPNPEYYVILKDFEEHAEFRAANELTPSLNTKPEESRVVILGFTEDKMAIYQYVDTCAVPVSIKE